MLELLGLSNTSERIAQRVGDQAVDALSSLAVLGLPVDVVLPSIRFEGVTTAPGRMVIFPRLPAGRAGTRHTDLFKLIRNDRRDL